MLIDSDTHLHAMSTRQNSLNLRVSILNHASLTTLCVTRLYKQRRVIFQFDVTVQCSVRLEGNSTVFSTVVKLSWTFLRSQSRGLNTCSSCQSTQRRVTLRRLYAATKAHAYNVRTHSVCASCPVSRWRRRSAQWVKLTANNRL